MTSGEQLISIRLLRVNYPQRPLGPDDGVVNVVGLMSGGDQSSAWLRWDGRVRSGGSGGGGQPGDVVPDTEVVGHLAAVLLGVEQVTTGPEVR